MKAENFIFKKFCAYVSWIFNKMIVRLFFSASFQCRFVTKYRHCDGKLCVKVTDDKAVSN